jgi:hypothetical protein
MAAPGAVIYQWLERIGLGYAVPHFQAAGITTPQQLASIEMAEGAADRLNIATGEEERGNLVQRSLVVRMTYTAYLCERTRAAAVDSHQKHQILVLLHARTAAALCKVRTTL